MSYEFGSLSTLGDMFSDIYAGARQAAVDAGAPAPAIQLVDQATGVIGLRKAVQPKTALALQKGGKLPAVDKTATQTYTTPGTVNEGGAVVGGGGLPWWAWVAGAGAAGFLLLKR